MIVCDECRDVTVKGYDCAIVIEKQDQPRITKANRRTEKSKPREVCKIPVVLCDKCLSAVLKNLGHLKGTSKLSGIVRSYEAPGETKNTTVET